jgi:hypothetical protein
MTQEEKTAYLNLLNAADALVTTAETCHICQGTLLVEEGPAHCEDCSWDCDEHEQPDCLGLDVLHEQLKRMIAKAREVLGSA